MAGGYERKLEIKYSVVVEICNAKNILFAEVSSTPNTTKRDKILKWQEIFEHSVSIGGINATRNWSYLRDVYWPNIKRSTMTKVHRQSLLSRIDIVVLEILNLKMVSDKRGDKIKGEIHKLEKVLKERQMTPRPNFDDSESADLLPIKQESVSFPNSPVASSHHDDDDFNDHLDQFNNENSLQADNLEAAKINIDPLNQCTTKDDDFKKINLTLNTSLYAATPPPPSSSSTPLPIETPTTTTTPNTKDTISILRKRKLEEQVEYLRLQNVKARLEIKETEIRVKMLEKDLELKNLQMAEKLK